MATIEKNDNQGTAEQRKAEVAAARAARDAEKAAKTSSAAGPMIPMSKDDAGIAAAASAEALMLEMEANVGVIDEARWKKLDETYHVFVRCRNTHRTGRVAHGIYLSEYPRTTSVPYTKWYARKVKEDPAQAYYMPRVYCQACLLDNIQFPLDAVRVVSPQGDLEIDPRWICRRPKDPKRALVEGETTVFTRQLESQNMGRREALARSRKEGFEVYDE
jgi:hypothetical protein